MMKILCLVKFIPDVDEFTYDEEKHVLNRERQRLILNPDDACAVAYALQHKKRRPETWVGVISLGPYSIAPQLEDLLRRNVDAATLISDPAYAGSDTFVTSLILARYLAAQTFDCILTGTHALDGDTAHVPAQVAELLGLPQMSNLIRLEEELFAGQSSVVEADDERSIERYQVLLPAVLSLQRESGYKLPHVKYNDLQRDVSHSLSLITNAELAFEADEVGASGSLTKVTRTFVRQYAKKERQVVHADAAGIETVYKFLQQKGFV